MTDDQSNFLSKLILQFATQLSDQEKKQLARAPHIDRVKEYAPTIYQKLVNTLNQGIIDHLKTVELARVEYWGEFILEMIYVFAEKIEITPKNRYDYWINWKIQDCNLKLQDKQ